MHYFKYKQGENVLYEYADDIAPRHLTATLPLDYDTVAAADKFGNLFVTRLPPDVSSQVSWPLCSAAWQKSDALHNVSRMSHAVHRPSMISQGFQTGFAGAVWHASAASRLSDGCR